MARPARHTRGRPPAPFFSPSKPRAVEGGLRARTKRGAIAQAWWSERFIAVLENIGIDSRLQRGRSYARKGQLISLDVEPGAVRAQVQGSRARPYRVRIGITAFGKAEWTEVERELAGSAWYLAKLLTGEMPDDIEDVFDRTGLALFPASSAELSMDCSCPDWEVPCKHLAATFYLLAESFDDDPFRILTWRGRERDDLLGNLQAARGDNPSANDSTKTTSTPLQDCLDSYFSVQHELPTPSARVTPATALLDQLPPVDTAVRSHPLTDLLRPAYQALGDS